ncbi:unnamed protein product [Allacma fusca]|uniref:Uncharacterized protein n=1 Tax=Allacma fusca TaxID=39272 RepID=A0A8J2Q1E6_9HEXA|nr:unnamed protein product [Allacma fusca]
MASRWVFHIIVCCFIATEIMWGMDATPAKRNSNRSLAPLEDSINEIDLGNSTVNGTLDKDGNLTDTDSSYDKFKDNMSALATQFTDFFRNVFSGNDFKLPVYIHLNFNFVNNSVGWNDTSGVKTPVCLLAC